MITYPALSGRKLRAAVVTAALLVLVNGCGNDLVSPCADCTVPPGGKVTAVVERTFGVGDAVTVAINNFAGSVTYRQGDPGTVHIKAIKRATVRSQLDRIELTMESGEDGVEIRSKNPDNFQQATVDLEITAPVDARPHARNGAGPIHYWGRPRGMCSFSTGAGPVRLYLDADVAITVDLTTGAGKISVDFPVEGTVAAHAVRGRIGSGADGTVYASTGAGNIYLVRR